jgi:hypothetical protein
MRKIPTIFLRDWENNPRYVTSRPNPECAWVFEGAGRATRKFDGTCVRYAVAADEEGAEGAGSAGSWWARREVKPGKNPPPGFVEIARDDTTGKIVGWEPAERSSFWKYLDEAIGEAADWAPGTYELIGPKINGNPEGSERHTLVRHGADDLGAVPLDYAGLAAWLRERPWEGIVFHGSHGRLAKIKRRDFAAADGAVPIISG